jgi:hypothetical protein
MNVGQVGQRQVSYGDMAACIAAQYGQPRDQPRFPIFVN